MIVLVEKKNDLFFGELNWFFFIVVWRIIVGFLGEINFIVLLYWLLVIELLFERYFWLFMKYYIM